MNMNFSGNFKTVGIGLFYFNKIKLLRTHQNKKWLFKQVLSKAQNDTLLLRV